MTLDDDDPYAEVRRPLPDDALDEARYAAELAALTDEDLAADILDAIATGEWPPVPMFRELLRRQHDNPDLA